MERPSAKGKLKGGVRTRASSDIVFVTDIPSPVAGTLQGFTLNAGQASEAGTRVYVHEDIYNEFSAALAEAVKELKIGPGGDPESNNAPLVSQEQLKSVVGYLEEGKADGAIPITRSTYDLNKHYPGHVHRQEEVVGPVTVSIPVSSAEEVILATNGSGSMSEILPPPPGHCLGRQAYRG